MFFRATSMLPRSDGSKAFVTVMALASLVGPAACSFSPSFPEGKIACNESVATSCPPGLSCIAGFCRSHGADAGVAMDGAASVDGSARADLISDPVVRDGEAAASGDDAKPTDAPLLAADTPPAEVFPDTTILDAPSVNDLRLVDVATPLDGRADLSSDLTEPDTALGKDGANGDSRDAGSDLGADGPACQTACQPGDSRCGPGGGLQTCGLVAGCPAWSSELGCGGSKTCQGASPTASCKCPAPPAYCSGAGMACADGNTLATCALDSSQCLVATTTSCATAGLICTGSFPSAICASACAATPVGCQQGVGSSCSGGDVVTCSKGSNGCFQATSTPCGAGMVCGGSFPTAKCSCPPVPAGCENGASKGCSGTDIIMCSTATNGCVEGTVTSCPPANLTPACSAGTCTGVCNAGYADCNNDKQTDGCEVNLTNDPAHCGGCTQACNSGVVCQDSVCAVTRWGLSSGTTTSNLGLGANTLAAMNVTISATNPNLVALGAQTSTAGVKFRLALYSNPSNAPSALLAQTGELTSVANAQVEGYLTATAIPAGIYWLAILSQSAVQVVAEATTAEYFTASGIAFGSMPTQFPASSAAMAPKAHLYAITSP